MIPHPTHKVVITLSSQENSPEVNVKVEWQPLLGDDEIEALGYIPAAYSFAEGIIMSMETAMDMAKLLEVEEGDLDGNRTIN